MLMSTMKTNNPSRPSKYSCKEYVAAQLRKRVLFNLVTKASPDSATSDEALSHKRGGMKRRSARHSELLPNEKT